MTLKNSDKILAMLLILAVMSMIIVVGFVKSPHFRAGERVVFTNNLCGAPFYCTFTHENPTDRFCIIQEDC